MRHHKLIVLGAFTVALAIVTFWLMTGRSFFPGALTEKVYIAVEGEGKIVVINPKTETIVRVIDLAVQHDGGILTFAPHNIQASPDGTSVWVTANAGTHEAHAASLMPRARAHGEAVATPEPDEVVIIDPASDRIIKRIGIAPGVHLAHVIFSPDSSTAYVTAQLRDTIYRINAKTYAIEARIGAPSKSEPHGIRMAPDGRRAYVALLAGKALGILNISENSLTPVPLEGQAVQTGVTPDGRFVLASLYDARSLAIYRVSDGSLRTVKLPETARGPIQMYPTPDSAYVYLADQGYYFSQPVGNRVYKIDITSGTVVQDIPAGKGPHGVVVSPDGKAVFVTNLQSGDVSVIDTATDQERTRIFVGREPNGITYWAGGMTAP